MSRAIMDVVLVVKADGPETMWQMNRLVEGLGGDIEPVGAVLRYRVTMGIEKSHDLLCMSSDERRKWAQRQRFGMTAFQVVDVEFVRIGFTV